MDSVSERMAANLRKHHEDRIRQCAERIARDIGYVMQALDAGKPGTARFEAGSVITDAHEIAIRMAVLDGIAEMAGIMEAEAGDRP